MTDPSVSENDNPHDQIIQRRHHRSRHPHGDRPDPDRHALRVRTFAVDESGGTLGLDRRRAGTRHHGAGKLLSAVPSVGREYLPRTLILNNNNRCDG